MKNILVKVIGISLILNSMLFGIDNKIEVHNDMNNKSGQGMLHGKMKPYHHMIMVDGYKVMVSSGKALKRGLNDIIIVILKGKVPMSNLDVNIEFSIANTKINKAVIAKRKSYLTTVDFNTDGHWVYRLSFKTNDNKIHKTNGGMDVN